MYALTAAYRSASASYWVPTSVRVCNAVHACDTLQPHLGGPLNGTRTCACAKRVQVTCEGVPHAISTRLSSGWPVLSDPWFTNRVLGPLAWWSNTQLENFYNVARSGEQPVANPYHDISSASRWGAQAVWDPLDWTRPGASLPPRPGTADLDSRPGTAASGMRTARTGRSSIAWTNALPRTGATRAQIKVARRRTSVVPMMGGVTGVALHGLMMPSHGTVGAPSDGQVTVRPGGVA
jgi:hypothetical protein